MRIGNAELTGKMTPVVAEQSASAVDFHPHGAVVKRGVDGAGQRVLESAFSGSARHELRSPKLVSSQGYGAGPPVQGCGRRQP